MEAFKNWVILRKYTASKPEELNLQSPTQEQMVQRVVMVMSKLLTKPSDVNGDHDVVMLDYHKNRGQSVSPRQLSATATASVPQ
jgi:hypothetical protein